MSKGLELTKRYTDEVDDWRDAFEVLLSLAAEIGDEPSITISPRWDLTHRECGQVGGRLYFEVVVDCSTERVEAHG